MKRPPSGPPRASDSPAVGRRTLLRAVAGGGLLPLAVGTAGAHETGGRPAEAAGTDHQNGVVETVAHPADYTPLGSVAVAGAMEAVVDDAGTVAYLAVNDGFAVVSLADPAAPLVVHEERGLLADGEGPLRNIQDVKVAGDRLLVAGPANSGQGDLLAAVLYDVTDPTAPERLDVLETEYLHHNVFLDGRYAYLSGIGVPGSPLVVVDTDGDRLREVARWSPADVDERWLDVSGGLVNLHDLFVRDGLAALAYWDGGTWLLDVSEPTAPTPLARVGGLPVDELVDLESSAASAESIQPPGNHHYVTLDGEGLLAVGKESWDARTGDGRGGPSGVDLYDVSDPTTPTRLSGVEPPPTADPTFAGTYTTAHNLELTGGRLYTAWYGGGVRLYDVTDPTAPRPIRAWRDSTTTSFWTARAGRVGEFFVASSRRRSPSGGALYVFPDVADVRAEPTLDLPVHPPATVDDGSTTTDTATTDGESTTTTATTDAATTRTTTTTDTTTDDATTVGGPGFGLPAALLGLGGGALAAWRRAGDRR